MNTSSLRRRYLESFAGLSAPETPERGRAGYSLGRRYLASLLGIRLLPQPPSAADSRSDPGVPGVEDKGSHRGYVADDPAASNDLVSKPASQDAVGLPTQEIGYRGPIVCAAAGITPRQLDYWARTGLVEPSVRPASGSGSGRLYGFRDILVLKVVKRLLDTGISLQQIRAAVQHLRDRRTSDLAQVTLMSDGVSVYECTSVDEVVDLLQGGQGVFGIALGRVWQEVEGTLADFPAAQAEGPDPRDTRGPGSAERREQAEELLASLPETVSSMSKLPKKEHEALVILLADLPPTVSSLAELRGVLSAAEGKRNTA